MAGFTIFFHIFILSIFGSQSQTNPAAHLNFDDTPIFRVGPPWEQATKGENAIYECEQGVVRRTGFNLLLGHESPLPTKLLDVALDLAVEFSSQDADEIAANCKSKYAGPFEQIGCVSRSLRYFFRGKKFKNLNSECRSYAYAFNKTFDKLKIPRSNSITVGLDVKFTSNCISGTHVINKIVLVSEDGQPYAYFMDSGAFPGVAFPITQATIDYQKSTRHPPDLSAHRRCLLDTLPRSGLIDMYLNLIKK